MKCYCASFNVGNIEVWGSELYLDKESIFWEIENLKDEIAERIYDFATCFDKKKIYKIIEFAISGLKAHGIYQDEKYNFDFFILEQVVWDNYKQKIEENGTN